jgi:hypothetical protein
MLCAALVMFGILAPGQETPVGRGATWKYLDTGQDQGTAWRAPGFDDGTWASGPAQLGYGDGDEATTVGFGGDPNNRFITTYFRKTFTVANPARFQSAVLRLLRDDGAVVWLNGVEIRRDNLPAGPVSFGTLALSSVTGAEENAFTETSFPPGLLMDGINTLAVEIHQAAANSSDIGFDLELSVSELPAAPTVTRGPYLQSAAPVCMTIRWRTDLPTSGRVRFGVSPANLTATTDEMTVETEHEVTLTGLTPATTYFYSIGTFETTLAGGTTDFTFQTPPLTATPTRVWVLGDSGRANAGQAAVRDSFLAFNANAAPDLWLMLGDNAYENGLDTEYQAGLFNVYPSVLRRSPLWPTIGNHDTAQATKVPLTIPYFQNFSLPRFGEAGGVASGTERYYSFDFGNIHFVCLDSMTSWRVPGTEMLTWLTFDLAINTKPWVIAYWHHPPYTKGTHDSDTERELVEMRQNILPVLEAGGVDLVLSGHSHVYERSFLIDGHYGLSGTFVPAMKKDGGDGRVGGTGAYRKPTLPHGPHEGTVYVVCGTSGLFGTGFLNHPAMYFSEGSLGSMVLDIDGNRLDARYLRADGTVGDSFTIIKGGAPAAPFGLTGTVLNGNRLNLEWSAAAGEIEGFRIERCFASKPGTFEPVMTVGASARSCLMKVSRSSGNVRFRVCAFNSAGVSLPSETFELVWSSESAGRKMPPGRSTSPSRRSR